ncbi:uncharacterized protein zgc:194621 isoform X2 [Acipenser ruthenus]|uniref:uncharacterized protein zgc:194621 isoform X2 n=1 Tax=Acipenser ruthenus TaxID=7906 RepID=UPI00274199AA|nr:uncharacterized protein zgc:194621 isoform X2 [Acipenser ruthenus]
MSHTFVNKPRTAQVKVQTRLNSNSEVNSTNRSRNCSNASTDVSSLGTTNRKTTLPATSKPQSTVNQKGQHVQKLNAVQQKSANKVQSYGAFTVIPPDQKKRNELQKRGSLTMEEVRRKQQEEMKMAKSQLKSNKPGTSSAAQE